MAVVFSRRESRQDRRNLNGGHVPDHGAFKSAAGSGTGPCDTREIHGSSPESPPGQRRDLHRVWPVLASPDPHFRHWRNWGPFHIRTPGERRALPGLVGPLKQRNVDRQSARSRNRRRRLCHRPLLTSPASSHGERFPCPATRYRADRSQASPGSQGRSRAGSEGVGRSTGFPGAT
jgi:hypothetical protein